MVDHLQRAAQGVARRVAGRVFAVQVEQVAPDRVGRERAIAEQVVPVVVAQLDRVLLEGGDEIDAVLRRDAGLGQARAQAVGGREGGVFGVAPGDGVLEALEAADLVLRRQRRVVGDVVDRPGEAVEGRDVRPQARRQQPGADGEVLVARALARRRLGRPAEVVLSALRRQGRALLAG